MSGWLLIFLFINVLVIGALLAIAIQHAYAHFHPHELDHPHGPAPQTAKLPPAVREKLLEAAEKRFQKVLDQSAVELQRDLQQTTAQLNKQLDHIGNNVVGKEMQHYQAELADMRAKAEAALSGAQAAVATQHEEIKAKLAEEMAAEKQRLVAQIDTKLADAVAGFLAETLQHNVDLGAQTAYLTAQLEEHKAEFAREVAE